MCETFLDGDEGMQDGVCPNRGESPPMNTKSRSLVLVNFFHNTPNRSQSCADNSAQLLTMLKTCHAASGNRWANFIAVDYYQVIIFLSKFSLNYYQSKKLSQIVYNNVNDDNDVIEE
jgi:hypothetical protein